MKKNVFYYAFAVMLSAALFTSCSDDDDELSEDPDTSSEVTDDTDSTDDEDESSVVVVNVDDFVGKYKGTLDVNMVSSGIYIPMGTVDPQAVTVEANDSVSVNLSITNFSFLELEIGDIDLDECELEADEEEEGVYSCQKEGEVMTFNLIGSCTMDYEISFSGDSLKITLDIEATALGQNVKVTYAGAKMSGTESSEAYILSFDFDTSVEANTGVISASIDNDNYTISVIVDSTAVVSGLIPTITVSDGATVTPASGEAVDFTSGSVTFTVTAEDCTVNKYTATISGTQIFYDFEEWTVASNQSIESNKYPIATGWASNNEAIVMIKTFGFIAGISYTGGWPVTYTEDAHSGSYAAKLEAVDTQGGSVFGQTIPKVTPGTLFLGSFSSSKALTDPMATTSFGNLYSGKPLQVSGYYKYTPGDEFYDSDGNLQEGTVDKCSMAAVLYEVDSSSETLDGSNIYTSDKIVAMGYKEYGETVTEYKEFNIDLVYYSDYDSSKKYKFAVIFSTSADGANYYAAVGSTLYIDDVAIINEY